MSVAVIGGGYAGMAAAVTLAQEGVAVTVYEAGPQLGGRARRVTVNGVALDNGCHILLGAYTELLRLIRLVHPSPDQALARFPLDWNIQRRFRLKAAPLPSPLHLAAGLLAARGAPWPERVAAAKFVRDMRSRRYALARDVTVKELLADHRQGAAMVRWFWEPLCVAALNTPPARASAQIFLNVLRDGVDAHRRAGDMLLARHDLSSLFPDPAADYVRARGGSIESGALVTSIEPQASGVRVSARGATTAHEHAICAVSPHRAGALLSGVPELAKVAATVGRFRYQPIHSVYLQFDGTVRLPSPMLGLGGTAQWIFDREAICGQRGMVAAVISAEGAHQGLTQDALAGEVHAQLECELGPLPPLAWHRVIAEKRATFECTVGLERPRTRTPLPNVHLAGDYTDSGYPATLESAVRSGIAAAKQVIDGPPKL